MSDDRPDWLPVPSPKEPGASRGSAAVHAASLFLSGVGASLTLVAALSLPALIVKIDRIDTNRVLFSIGTYFFGSLVCLTMAACLHWRSARAMFLAAMIVQSIAGTVVLCGSVVWLAFVFLANLFGRTIPAIEFTWDRFGPPLVTILAAIFVAAFGITGIGLARMGTTDGEVREIRNHDDTTTRRRD